MMEDLAFAIGIAALALALLAMLLTYLKYRRPKWNQKR